MPPAELCVVGDADQSIYAFRGATIRNILEFERDYPDARTILLEQNYRSTQTILSAANAVIDRNTERKPKRLWSDQGDGEQIVGYVADTEHAEADWVAREIDRLTDAGEIRPGRRRGVLPHQRTVPCLRRGVHPHRPAVQGGRRGPVLRAQGGPRRAGLPAGDRQRGRHGQRPAHPEHAAPGHRRPGRGVRRGAVRRDRISFGAALRRAADAPGIAPRSANAIAEFVAMMDELRDDGRDGAARRTCWRRCSRAPDYLAELEESLDPQDAGRVENLQELVSVAREYTERILTPRRRSTRTPVR